MFCPPRTLITDTRPAKRSASPLMARPFTLTWVFSCDTGGPAGGLRLLPGYRRSGRREARCRLSLCTSLSFSGPAYIGLTLGSSGLRMVGRSRSKRDTLYTRPFAWHRPREASGLSSTRVGLKVGESGSRDGHSCRGSCCVVHLYFYLTLDL